MELVTVIIFAFAVSLDGFGVGLAYGIRRISIPVFSILIISLTSALAITLAMFAGQAVGALLDKALAQKIGAFILAAVGIWLIWQAFSQQTEEKIGGRQDVKKTLVNLKIKPFGVVIQVLREPVYADLDYSGRISSREAFILGAALAMDAFGAGFAVAVAGLGGVIVAVLVGLFKFFLVSLGLWSGKVFDLRWLGRAGSYIPGSLLIFLAIIQL